MYEKRKPDSNGAGSCPDEAGKLRVLLVEDDKKDAELCLFALRQADFDPDCKRVQTAEEFLRALQDQEWDLVLSDYALPGFDAMEALRLLRRFGSRIPLIIVTGVLDDLTAVECVKGGADDYILKGNLTRLAPAIEKSLQMHQEQRERRRLQSELQHSQKLEAIGHLAAGVAHDFNNLLTVISGHAELLSGSPESPGQLKKSIRSLREAVEEASGVTRSLLSFSRKLRSTKKPLDLCAAFHKTALLLRRILEAKIRLDLDFDETIPPVHGDKVQLQQVLLNLAINARDAMPDGGGLRIALSCTEEGQVRVTVEDSGEGMSEEVMERIFEPFFTTKPAGQGTGLGLSVTRRIIRDHGGALRVESKPGQGSRFTIDLPAAAGAACQDVGRVSRPRRGNGELVLLAEDNDQVRSVLAGALSSLGYQVEEARDGGGAMSAFKRLATRLHLLIFDIDLPVRSGIECLRRIRAQGYDVPAVLMTGNTQPEIDSTDLGRMQLLIKPFTIPELTVVMEHRYEHPPVAC